MGLLGRLILRAIISISIIGFVLSGLYDLFQCFLLTFALLGIDVMIEKHDSKPKGVNE